MYVYLSYSDSGQEGGLGGLLKSPVIFDVVKQKYTWNIKV